MDKRITFLARHFFQIFVIAGFAFVCSGCGWFVMDDNRDELETQLVQVGQESLLVLPSDQMFYPNTANFVPRAYDLLDGAADYLKAHGVRRMTVKGYLNSGSSERMNQVISKKQATKVMNYLWSHMDDSVWIQVLGMGSQDSISVSDDSEKKQQNRRVTISFMDRDAS